MIMLCIFLSTIAWIILPDLISGLGLVKQPEIDVYDRWVDLQLTRTYVQGYKGIG